jgi:spermidine synthase
VSFSVRFTTDLGEYTVSDVMYQGRQARVLYSGDHLSAQSGIPLDGNDSMLFDYNQRFMELAEGLKPASVLLIGGGCYTLPTALLRNNPDLLLHIVEPDAQMEPIAQRYFGYQPGSRTQTFITGGADYLTDCDQRYDMIFIDAFLDDKVPTELQTTTAATDLRRVLKPHGLLAMNVIAAARGRHATALLRQIETLAIAFGTVEAYPAANSVSTWLPQNFVLCAGDGHPEDYLRYPAIVPTAFD